MAEKRIGHVEVFRIPQKEAYQDRYFCGLAWALFPLSLSISGL